MSIKIFRNPKLDDPIFLKLYLILFGLFSKISAKIENGRVIISKQNAIKDIEINNGEIINSKSKSTPATGSRTIITSILHSIFSNLFPLIMF